MKVLLRAGRKRAGKKGEIVNVSDGYARNYLFSPRKLAAEATRDVLNSIERHDEAVRRRNEEEQAKAMVLAKAWGDDRAHPDEIRRRRKALRRRDE
jgi:large subunit ribosomal protein L9